MKTMKIIYMLIATIILIGCTNPNGNFIGTWSNKNQHGGDLYLIIYEDGDKLMVNLGQISSGGIYGTYPAKVEDGYIYIEGINTFYEKIMYSQNSDTLVPASRLGSVPGFHRVK